MRPPRAGPNFLTYPISGPLWPAPEIEPTTAQPRMQRRRSGTMRPGHAALFLLCIMVAGAANPAHAASQYDSTHDACSVEGGCSVTQAAGEATSMPAPMPCMGMHEELLQR